MKIYRDIGLKAFKPWGTEQSRVHKAICANPKVLAQAEKYYMEKFPHGISEQHLNDSFIYDDFIFDLYVSLKSK